MHIDAAELVPQHNRVDLWETQFDKAGDFVLPAIDIATLAEEDNFLLAVHKRRPSRPKDKQKVYKATKQNEDKDKKKAKKQKKDGKKQEKKNAEAVKARKRKGEGQMSTPSFKSSKRLRLGSAAPGSES
jgi:hypothetical protein